MLTNLLNKTEEKKDSYFFEFLFHKISIDLPEIEKIKIILIKSGFHI